MTPPTADPIPDKIPPKPFWGKLADITGRGFTSIFGFLISTGFLLIMSGSLNPARLASFILFSVSLGFFLVSGVSTGMTNELDGLFATYSVPCPIKSTFFPSRETG